MAIRLENFIADVVHMMNLTLSRLEGKPFHHHSFPQIWWSTDDMTFTLDVDEFGPIVRSTLTFATDLWHVH